MSIKNVFYSVSKEQDGCEWIILLCLFWVFVEKIIRDGVQRGSNRCKYFHESKEKQVSIYFSYATVPDVYFFFLRSMYFALENSVFLSNSEWAATILLMISSVFKVPFKPSAFNLNTSSCVNFCTVVSSIISWLFASVSSFLWFRIKKIDYNCYLPTLVFFATCWTGRISLFSP